MTRDEETRRLAHALATKMCQEWLKNRYTVEVRGSHYGRFSRYGEFTTYAAALRAAVVANAACYRIRDESGRIVASAK